MTPESERSGSLLDLFRSGGGSSETFGINFIRSKSFFHLERRLGIFVMSGYLALQALLLLVLVLWGVCLRAEAGRLDKEFQQAFPSGSSSEEFVTQVEQLTGQAQQTLDELRAAIVIEKDKFRIAGKLAGIVRTVPVRTWVSSIKLDASKRSMNIEAYYMIDANDPYQLPVKGWIEALRKDPGFGPGLNKIEQVRSTQTQKGTTDLAFFEIQAGW